MWGNIAIAFLLAFIVSFMATPYTIKIAKKVGAVSIEKGKRRMHNRQMPKFGGPAVILGFLVSVGYLLIVMSLEGGINLFGEEQYGKKLLGMLLGIIVLAITCIIDDIKTIKPLTKLSGQLLAAIIVISFGIRIDDITLPFLPTHELNEIFSYILTLGWIVGITNAINLIDGLDGLSSGIASIYFLTIGVIAMLLNNSNGLDIILTFIMLGSTLGFLVHNFNPAKIFMGDSGSMFLGYIIAVIALLGFKNITLTSFLVPMLLLAIPIMDTLFAIIRRKLKGQSIDHADKEHLHHQLLKHFSKKSSLLVIYAINIMFSATTIFYVLGDKKIVAFCYVILMFIVLYFVLKTNIIFDWSKPKEKEKKK